MYSFREDEKKQMIDEISYFFKEEYDLNLGIIGVDNVFDFFRELFGDRIYNMALDDAKRFYQKRAEDMDADYYALYKDVR